MTLSSSKNASVEAVEFILDTHTPPLSSFELIATQFFNEKHIISIDHVVVTRFIDFCTAKSIRLRPAKPTSSVMTCLNVILKRLLGAYKSTKALAMNERKLHTPYTHKDIPTLVQYEKGGHEWLTKYVHLVLTSSGSVNSSQLVKSVLTRMNRDKVIPSYKTSASSQKNLEAIVEYESEQIGKDTYRPHEIRAYAEIDRSEIRQAYKCNELLRSLVASFLRANSDQIANINMPIPMLHEHMYVKGVDKHTKVIDYGMTKANYHNAINLFRSLASSKNLDQKMVNRICQLLNLYANMYSSADSAGLFQPITIPHFESMLTASKEYSGMREMRPFKIDVKRIDYSSHKSILHHAIDYTPFTQGREGYSLEGVFYDEHDNCEAIDSLLSSIFCSGTIVCFKPVIQGFMECGYTTGLKALDNETLLSLLSQ